MHGRRVAGHPASERELILHPAGARQERHRAQDDGTMQPRKNVLAPLTEREPLTQLRACKHGAGAVDLHPALALLRQWAQLMQAEVHLVGDVAEVASASGSTAVVHLEADDQA